MLEIRGAMVRVAYSGRAALETLKDFKPILICIDLAMPEIDGYEIARRIRSLPQQSAKIVAVTAYPPHAVEERVRAAGFDRLLIKPVSAEAVKDLLG
jgi:CheY-like chemotaxis protein